MRRGLARSWPRCHRAVEDGGSLVLDTGSASNETDLLYDDSGNMVDETPSGGWLLLFSQPTCMSIGVTVFSPRSRGRSRGCVRLFLVYLISLQQWTDTKAVELKGRTSKQLED